MKLLEWRRIEENWPKEGQPGKASLLDQMDFVDYQLGPMIFDSDSDRNERGVQVISTHRSRSVTLPVFQLETREPGLRLTLRDNFYDWKMSLESEYPLAIHNEWADFTNLTDSISSCYCEGFPKELVFGSVSDSFLSTKPKFTVEFHSTYKLYAFVYLVVRQLVTKFKLKEGGVFAQR